MQTPKVVTFARFISSSLEIDLCPLSCGDGGDGGCIVCEEVPCVAALVHDIGVAVEDGYGELVGAQVLPDVFDRVEFGRVWRERERRDVVGRHETLACVPAGAVEDEYRVG